MAETRDTQVLEDVVESTEIENPRTTEEAILAKIIAGEEVNINARTRYQAYLKEFSSLSGGNPNYIETCPVGTVANPWGGKSITELNASALQNDINVYIFVDASSVTGVDFVMPLNARNSEDLMFTASSVFAAGSDVHDWGAFLVTYWINSVDVNILMDGSVIIGEDATPFLSLPANIIIFHHPLPEDNS